MYHSDATSASAFLSIRDFDKSFCPQTTTCKVHPLTLAISRHLSSRLNPTDPYRGPQKARRTGRSGAIDLQDREVYQVVLVTARTVRPCPCGRFPPVRERNCGVSRTRFCPRRGASSAWFRHAERVRWSLTHSSVFEHGEPRGNSPHYLVL